MNYQYFHDLTFDVLYACIVILIFVILERGFYLSYLGLRAGRIARALEQVQMQTPGTELQTASTGLNPEELKAADPISRAVASYAALSVSTGVTRDRLEDYSSALFIGIDKKISARLWVLDTIITAAPLLGLLGTILGIMETFTALAQGGVSDPAEVSRGIGTALVATAIGIATALLGLIGHNVLNRRAHTLTEDFKSFLLRLTR